ncbi:gliding motility-associated C-terminal domain-containing protein [Pontibacter mangrovi]|uniref:T9SS type B sorting domain-containing protein n=1 Tax=Pontibacter mangrovi TaxID=2589816 RepID=A0A501W8D3_9BACT|nr:gliding motility-associated C-terminal domain-containing protein [Pontibacter mangrovi]TPE43077.1 T9SS type B sorting domain-containing protein [Pontibacter mangrovi]
MRTYAKGILCLLVLQLWSALTYYSYAQTNSACDVDASIANTNFNKSFTYCSYNYSGKTISVKFDFENTSTTKATNKSYRIDWGDGSSDTYGPDFDKTSHTYVTSEARSYNMVLTAVGENGCEKTETKKVYIGSNPNVLVDLGGNSFSCAPATYNIKVSRFEDNPANTLYTFTINDGTPSFTRTHAELLKDPVIPHQFTEASPAGGFSVTCRASNDCSYSESTWTGIRVTKGPVAEIGVKKNSSCVNQEIVLQDRSTDGYDGFGSEMPHIADWQISPSTGWEMRIGKGEVRLVFTETGDYTVKLIVSPEDPNTTCVDSFKEMQFHIVDPPIAAFTPTLSPENGCTTNTVSISNTTQGESVRYNWAVTDTEGKPVKNWGTIEGGATAKEPAFSFTKPGEYRITLTADNGCSPSTVTQNVTIKGQPTVALPAAQTYCGPQTLEFSDANASHAPAYDAQFGAITGYKWEVQAITGDGAYTFENGTGRDSKNPAIRFTNPGTYEVTAYALSECGESSAPARQTITINPLPELRATSPSAAICIGGSTTISMEGADHYTWAPATGLSATTGSTVTANPSETTTYTITGTNEATGCSSTTTFTVVVNPLPQIQVISGKGEICLGQEETRLSASGADTYTWAPATGLSATTGADVTANPSETTTYTVTGYNSATGCSSTAEVTVTVLPLPEVNAGPDLTVCDDPTPLQLQASPAGGVWSGAHVSASGEFIPDGKGTFELTYTYTNEKGCTNSDNVTVEVTDVAQAEVEQKEMEVCLNGGQFILGASPAGGSWSGSKYVSEDGTFTPSAVGTYTLTYTVYTGSCFTTDQMQVTVKPLPAAPVITGVQDICYNTATTLQTDAQTGAVNWYDQPNGGKLLGTTPAGTGFETGQLTKTTNFFAEYVGDNQCASTRTKVTVIVRPEIVAPEVAPVTICGAGTATLVAKGTASRYNWYDASGKLVVSQGNKVFEPTVEQSTSFFVEAVIGNCAGPRTQVQVTVNPILDNNTVTAPEIVCANAPLSISGSEPVGGGGAGTYTFQWMISPDGSTFEEIEGATGKVYQAQAGLKEPAWFKRVVYSSGCELASEAVKVEVIPAITKNELREVPTICHGQVPEAIQGVVAGGAAPYTYTWFVSTDNINFKEIKNSNSDSYQPTAPLTDNTWYKRVVKSGSCQEVTSNTVMVRVMPPISKNLISGTQTICEGDAATLTGQVPEGGYGPGSYTFYWESKTADGEYREVPNSRGTSKKDWTAQSMTETTTFRRVVVSGSCTVSTSDPVVVTVNPKILNLISGDQEVCQGGVPALLTSLTPTTGGEEGKYSYSWEYKSEGDPNFMPAPGNSTRADGSYQPGSVSKTTQFRRKVTSGGCTSFSEPVTVLVNPAVENYNIKASQSIYAGTKPAPLTGLNTAPVKGGNGKYSYRWEFSLDGTSFEPADGNNQTADYTFPRGLYKDTWYRRVVMSGGCEVVSNEVKITVIAEIANNIIRSDQTICTGNVPERLEGGVPQGGEGHFNYRWEMSTKGDKTGFVTAQGYNNAPNNEQSFQPGPVSQDTWFRRVTTSGAYTDISNAILISVRPELSNNVVLSGTQTVCYGSEPAALAGSVPAGGSGQPAYLWEQSNAQHGIYTPAPGQNDRKDYTPSPLTENTWFRRVVTSASCGTLTSNAVEVKVTPLPDMPVAQGANLCAGLSTTLTAKGKGGRLEWYASAAGGEPVATGSTFRTPALYHTTTYFVQEVQSCASKRLPVTVTVTEPTLSAGPDITVVKGRGVQLQAEGGLSYSWAPAEGMDNPNIANPTVTPEQTTVYTVTASTEGGCTFTDEVVVVVLPFVDIPNTFTPNHDGINDTWQIENIEKYSNCKVQVFNQWGNMVFSSEGYGQPWDGRQNGNPLPMATYYYIIKLDQNEKPLTGSVTIVK